MSATPTYGDGSGTGTFNSASLTADFANGDVGINMNFAIGLAPSILTYNTSGTATISGSRFTASGNITVDSFSSSRPTLIEGFFAGEGASHAGYVYHVQDQFFKQINGAVTFTRD